MILTKNDFAELLEGKSVDEVLKFRKEIVEVINEYLEKNDYMQTLSEDSLKETIYKALIERDSSWKSENREIYYGINNELFRAEIILNPIEIERLEAIEWRHRTQNYKQIE